MKTVQHFAAMECSPNRFDRASVQQIKLFSGPNRPNEKKRKHKKWHQFVMFRFFFYCSDFKWRYFFPQYKNTQESIFMGFSFFFNVRFNTRHRQNILHKNQPIRAVLHSSLKVSTNEKKLKTISLKSVRDKEKSQK